MVTLDLKNAFTEVSHTLFRSGAYSVRMPPFIYVSGKIGPVYVDCSRLQSNPDDWELVNQYQAAQIRAVEASTKLEKAVITGGETRDLPFSIPVAKKLGRPHLIIRKEQKGHGLGGNFAGGEIKEGDYAIHVADLLTQGTSAKKWVYAIRNSGGQIELYFVVFDRLQGGTQKLRDMRVYALSLSQMNDKFSNIGIDEKFVSKENYAEVPPYLHDPDTWSINYLRNHPEFIKDNIAVAPDGKIDSRKKGLAVFNDIAHPQLREELGPLVRQWLEELGVTQPVPEIGYMI